MIEFRNVNKTYETGTVAVNNANFKIINHIPLNHSW